MPGFIGTYSSKLDDKGRMVFPSPFRNVLPDDGPTTFVVRKDLFADCIEMYTLDEWESQCSRIRSRLNIFNKEHEIFWRNYSLDTYRVQPDPKFGRISVVKDLLDRIGVTKDVVFLGSDYKIEIWAKERFEAARISNEEFVAIAGRLPESR